MAQSEHQVTKLVVEIDDIQSLVAVMASQNGNLSHHSLTCTHTCKSQSLSLKLQIVNVTHALPQLRRYISLW